MKVTGVPEFHEVAWRACLIPNSGYLGNSQHTPTHLASLFVRLLRCRNSFVASYAPISTHGRQTKILRNMGSLFIAPYLTLPQLPSLQLT